MKSLLGLFFITSLIAGASTSTYAQSEYSQERLAHTMSIIGQGEHWVVPEVAEFSGIVVTRGGTLAEARDGHPEIVAKVRSTIEGLATRGLKIESAKYAMRETYPLRYDTSPNITAVEKEKPVFEATTSFRLTTESLSDLDDMISELAAGDMQIANIYFTVRNERVPLLEARKNAARDALGQATAYAEALGIKLVEIRSITDGDAMPPDGQADLAVVNDASGKQPLSIEVPDQLRYWARVTVDWTIGASVAP